MLKMIVISTGKSPMILCTMLNHFKKYKHEIVTDRRKFFRMIKRPEDLFTPQIVVYEIPHAACWLDEIENIKNSLPENSEVLIFIEEDFLKKRKNLVSVDDPWKQENIDDSGDGFYSAEGQILREDLLKPRISEPKTNLKRTKSKAHAGSIIRGMKKITSFIKK